VNLRHRNVTVWAQRARGRKTLHRSLSGRAVGIVRGRIGKHDDVVFPGTGRQHGDHPRAVKTPRRRRRRPLRRSPQLQGGRQRDGEALSRARPSVRSIPATPGGPVFARDACLRVQCYDNGGVPGGAGFDFVRLTATRVASLTHQ